jgi:hypothetical protein
MKKLTEWLRVLKDSMPRSRTNSSSPSPSLNTAKSPAELLENLKTWLKNKPPSEATPNAFGLSLGKTASIELRSFVSVFEHMAADTPEGEALRADGFVAADPNGSFTSEFNFNLLMLFDEVNCVYNHLCPSLCLKY